MVGSSAANSFAAFFNVAFLVFNLFVILSLFNLPNYLIGKPLFLVNGRCKALLSN